MEAIVVLIGLIGMYFALMGYNTDEIDSEIIMAKKKKDKDKAMEKLGRSIGEIGKAFRGEDND